MMETTKPEDEALRKALLDTLRGIESLRNLIKVMLEARFPRK